MSLGLAKGDRVCVFSPTRYEFTVLDYAIWTAGLATVTIYETSSAEQVEWIVRDSEAKAIICATDDLRRSSRRRRELSARVTTSTASSPAAWTP
jgi:long-chain acyl-CoA synthetase